MLLSSKHLFLAVVLGLSVVKFMKSKCESEAFELAYLDISSLALLADMVLLSRDMWAARPKAISTSASFSRVKLCDPLSILDTRAGEHSNLRARSACLSSLKSIKEYIA